MINDTNVDLTMDHKFHVTEMGTNRYYKITERKLFKKGMNALDIFEKHCRTKSHRLPWVKKKEKVDSEVSLSRRDKYKGDNISNEFQCRVRRTSDNHIMYISTNPDIPKMPEVLEEVYYEVVGYNPDYTSIKMCWHCGNKHLTHAKHLSIMCPQCMERYSRIPWSNIIIKCNWSVIMNLLELKEYLDRLYYRYSSSDDLKRIEVVITTAPDGTVGCRAFERVKSARVGFDWESNQFRIEPEQTLFKGSKE